MNIDELMAEIGFKRINEIDWIASKDIHPEEYATAKSLLTGDMRIIADGKDITNDKVFCVNTDGYTAALTDADGNIFIVGDEIASKHIKASVIFRMI